MTFLVANLSQEREHSRCLHCGKSIIVKRAWARFCSVECRRRFHYLQKNPKAAEPPAERRCQECDSVFETARADKRFCSDKCRTVHHAASNPRLRDLKTTAEMAAVLGVSSSTVRSRIRSGELAAHRVGGILLVVCPEPASEHPTISKASANAFAELAEREGLSLRQLGQAFGISKATASRLVNGETTLTAFRKARPAMMRSLDGFLSSIGKSPNEIAQTLETLFKDR